MVSKSRLSETVPSEESAEIQALFVADWSDRWDKPLNAAELLEIGRETFEPLFHNHPLGPIPDYLSPHASVHGCVIEYEERLEDIEKWKALQLSSWLNDKVGERCSARGKVYELCVDEKESTAPEKYWFKLIEDRSHSTPA